MLKGILASAGFGAAKVDTILENENLTQGDIVRGNIHLKGGNVAQDINKIRLSVMTMAKRENVFGAVAIDSYAIDYKSTIQPGETLSIPFEFQLPDETPITAFHSSVSQSHVWIETELDIEFGLDSTDKDYLTIYPHPAIHKVIDKFSELGFQIFKADVEVGYLRAGNFSSESGIYQEIEFKPHGGGFSGFGGSNRNIQEVELSFIPKSDRIHLLAEIDRYFSGDGYRASTFSPQISNADADQIARQILR